MTTLEDMDEILEELESRGVRDVMPVYFGWQRDGATRALGSGDFRIAPGLGSATPTSKFSFKEEIVPLA